MTNQGGGHFIHHVICVISLINLFSAFAEQSSAQQQMDAKRYSGQVLLQNKVLRLSTWLIAEYVAQHQGIKRQSSVLDYQMNTCVRCVLNCICSYAKTCIVYCWRWVKMAFSYLYVCKISFLVLPCCIDTCIDCATIFRRTTHESCILPQ